MHNMLCFSASSIERCVAADMPTKSVITQYMICRNLRGWVKKCNTERMKAQSSHDQQCYSLFKVGNVAPPRAYLVI